MRPYALLTALLLGTGLLAQTPEAFHYQGVARDAGGDALANTAIGVQFQLHQGTAVGTVVYSETHSPTTNELGLFSLEVGNGTPGTGTFAAIDWSSGPYFLEVGLDPAGGSSYSNVGTQQLLSVPYALHAKTADMADDGDWVVSGDTVHSNGRRVGIGTSAPSQDLDVEGTFQLKDGTQADKRILTSDAEGNASWQELSPDVLFGAGNVPPAYTGDLSCLNVAATIAAGTAPRSVAVSGDHAYVLNFGSHNMMVFDISIPSSPSLTATINAGSSPSSVAVSGDHAYVVNSTSGNMMVFDISSPASPGLLATIATGSGPNSVAISGGFAYVANFDSNNMMVFDVTNPASPSLSATIPTGIQPVSVAVSGDHAYVVNYSSNNMMVFDISTPASPNLIATTLTGLQPGSVSISGDQAYVLNRNTNNMVVIDISNPASPSLSATIATGSVPYSVAVSGDHAYVVNLSSNSMMVFDISNPASPSLSATIATGTQPFSVAVSGGHAYVVNSGSDNMMVFELFCPAEQQQVTYDPNTGAFIALEGWHVIADTLHNGAKRVGIGTASPDTTLHVAGKLKYQDGTQGDRKILTSDADGNASWQELSPQVLFGAGNVPPAYTACLDVAATIPTGTSPRDVTVSGDHAYVVNRSSNNMMVFDITNPASPSLSATIATGSDPISMAISGDHAYVVNYSSHNMMVFDITNPASPSLSATIATGLYPYSVAVSGDHAFVVNSNANSMMVFDISNPSTPSLSATIATGMSPRSVAISGDHAYVVNLGSNNMMVFNISNPASPSLSATIAAGSNPISVAVSGDHAYVVNYGSDNLMVFNISNPASPSLSAAIATDVHPWSVAISGGHAYLLNSGSDNMMVFDISNPASPSLSATIATGSNPYSVAVSGGHAYVVNNGSDNMMVFELFCPTEQQQVTYDPVAGSFGSAPQIWQASNDNVYVTDERVGIGTTAPSAKLDVRDTTSSEFRLSLSNSHWSKLRFSSSEGLRIEAKNEGIEFRPMLLIGSELRFMTGSGTTPERMRLASNGYLGIGTTTPVRPLHVTQGSGNPNVVLVEATGSPQAYLRFNDANTTNNANQPYIGSQGDAFTINTGGAEAIRVAADKDVQLNGFTKLGTNAPAVKMFYQTVPIDTSAAQFGNTVVDLPSYLTHENIVDVQILAHKYGPSGAGGEILTDQIAYNNSSGAAVMRFSWEIRRYSSIGQTNSFIVIGNNQINIGGIFPDGSLPYYKILITYIE